MQPHWSLRHERLGLWKGMCNALDTMYALLKLGITSGNFLPA